MKIIQHRPDVSRPAFLGGARVVRNDKPLPRLPMIGMSLFMMIPGLLMYIAGAPTWVAMLITGLCQVWHWHRFFSEHVCTAFASALSSLAFVILLPVVWGSEPLTKVTLFVWVPIAAGMLVYAADTAAKYPESVRRREEEERRIRQGQKTK